jgi:hypothetical protein
MPDTIRYIIRSINPLYLSREPNIRLKMRRYPSLILLILVAVSFAAHAAAPEHASVQQFEQILAAAHGQSDGKVASEIAGIKLTERVSSVRLARWLTEFPGKRCREELTVLADASAFLDLPAADIPADAPPNVQTQKAILLKAIDYVSSTITRLPDFFATRKTEHFEDTPARAGSSGSSPLPNMGSIIRTSDFHYEPLHSTGRSSATVSYVAGHELLGAKKDTDLYGRPPTELTSNGEFGSILVVVLLDAAKGRLVWGNWEQDTNGTNAVFRYAVRPGQSSYKVVLPHGTKNVSLFPAYHGEIAVNPASGAILRITAVADLTPPNEHAISSIMVEYGPVSIGGNTYICPVHSVALARVALGDPLLATTPMQMQLNDVAFVDYHHFHTEARILTGADATNDAPPAPSDPPK